MKQYLKTLRARLSAFRADHSGSISVEAVLIFPILIWAYIGCFVFFDAFRSQNTNLKAAYTISDMLSRESDVNDTYLDGLNVVFDYLTITTQPTWMRVSVVRWSSEDDAMHMIWSYATNGQTAYTEADIGLIEGDIPAMANGSNAIVVQTHMSYEPAFNIGFGQIDIDNIIVTPPRFTSQLCYNGSCDSLG